VEKIQAHSPFFYDYLCLTISFKAGLQQLKQEISEEIFVNGNFSQNS